MAGKALVTLAFDRSQRGSSRSPSWQKCLLPGLPELLGFDDEHEDRGGPEWHYEQRPLSYGIITNRLLHRLDRRFNRR